jgi:hypothetical protein
MRILLSEKNAYYWRDSRLSTGRERGNPALLEQEIKMKKTMHLKGLLAAACLALTACQTIPLQNIEYSPIHMTKSKYGLGDVEKAIVRAGTNLGWQMRTVKPGQVNGKLYKENMIAEVTIDFSLSLYSIKYLNSSNLRYSAKAGKPVMIYEDYNEWIQELDQAIRKELLVQP